MTWIIGTAFYRYITINRENREILNLTIMSLLSQLYS